MTSRPRRVLWDSCVIIDYLEQTPGRIGLIEPMIVEAEKGTLRIVVSEISVAEVCTLNGLAEEGVSGPEQAKIIEDWFEREYVSVRLVDRAISTKAAWIQRNYRAKTCDCVIMATALRHNVDALYTFDGCNDDGTPPQARKMLAYGDRELARDDGEVLQILVPAGRADGQTTVYDLAVAEPSDAN